MTTASKARNRATHRTVVLLRKSEKLKLERLATREKVSSAEIIRRFIESGEEILQLKQDQELIVAALKMISQAVVEANDSLCRSIDKIDRLHSELSKRAIP